MAISAKERLRRFYEQFSAEDHVLIIINADPDAIASAMAVKRLLWRKVAKADFAHVNRIDRPDNRAMIHWLGIDLCPLQQIDKKAYGKFVLVDSQPDHHVLLMDLAPQVVIDHHPKSCALNGFCDIRPEYGACSTILTEYLRAARIKPSAKLATALVQGIKTDTNDFVRKTIIEDVRAFQFLYRHANVQLIRQIEQAGLRLEYLKFFQHALQTRRFRKGRMFVFLGKVPNADICVLVADFLMKVNTVSWTIVCGIEQQKLVIILRNDGLRKGAGRVAKQSFGAFGPAGGHKSMARAELRLAELAKELPVLEQAAVLRWLVRRIEKRADSKPKG